MIVDLEMAKDQLRRADDSDDDRIFIMLEQAHLIVFDYLKLDATDYGGPGEYDIGPLWAAAVLKVLEQLYDKPDGNPEDVLVGLLRRSCDPAMA